MAVKMGEETVLFRHEKKFVNPCAFAVEVKDTASEDEITTLVEEVIGSEIDSVGQKLRINAIAITNASDDAGKFEAAAKVVAAKGPGCSGYPLHCGSARLQRRQLSCLRVRSRSFMERTHQISRRWQTVAKTNKAILGVAGNGIDELCDLTEKIKGLGVEDMVIDSGARKAKDILEHNTLMRRAAIKKNFKPVGYPVINFAQRENSLHEALIAVIGVAKYASIVVLSSIEKWKNLALFTLRQNIYTDPQVPMQVEQKIYNIGDAKAEAPLFITSNFSLTYFIVSGEIENSKVPSRLAVLDCEGLSVLTGWAAGKFTASKIAQFITESGVDKEISHKELIIPGYVAILSGSIEDKLPGWKITVGPREANAIPAFLKARAS